MDDIQPLHVGSENLLHLKGHQDTKDGSYPITAVVTQDLFDKRGNLIAGAIAMPYVSGVGPETDYQGVLLGSVPLVVDEYYEGHILADVGGHPRRYVQKYVGVAG